MVTMQQHVWGLTVVLQQLCSGGMYLEAYGDNSATDLLSHHELLSQHGQDDVLPEATGQAFPQADDPLAAAAVGLILAGTKVSVRHTLRLEADRRTQGEQENPPQDRGGNSLFHSNTRVPGWFEAPPTRRWYPTVTEQERRIPPTWVWSPPWTGGSHCVHSDHLGESGGCKTSRTAPPEHTHTHTLGGRYRAGYNTLSTCACVPMPRCRSGECFARNSENLQGDSASFGCTRRCSYTGGGVLLQPDRPSADRRTHKWIKTRKGHARGKGTAGRYLAPIVVCPITVVMVTLRLVLALLIFWTEKQTEGQTDWSDTCWNCSTGRVALEIAPPTVHVYMEPQQTATPVLLVFIRTFMVQLSLNFWPENNTLLGFFILEPSFRPHSYFSCHSFVWDTPTVLMVGFMLPGIIRFSAAASPVLNVDSSQEVTEISLSFKVTHTQRVHDAVCSTRGPQ